MIYLLIVLFLIVLFLGDGFGGLIDNDVGLFIMVVGVFFFVIGIEMVVFILFVLIDICR